MQKNITLMAVERGHVSSMHNLVLLYEDEKKDIAAAEKILPDGGGKGHVSSMYNLAYCIRMRKDIAVAENIT